MNHPKVTVVGSANVDLVIRAERMPNKGETRIGEAFDIFTGGKGFNQATAAARLGAEVTFIGRIGDDPFADILRAAIGAEHIDSQFVKTDAESGTGVATIVVEPDGENSIIVVPRANMCLTSKDIEDAADSIAKADVLLLQLETPIDASQSAIEIAKANDTIVILDPGTSASTTAKSVSTSGYSNTERNRGNSAVRTCCYHTRRRHRCCQKHYKRRLQKDGFSSSRANTWRTRGPAMYTNANHTPPRNSC